MKIIEKLNRKISEISEVVEKRKVKETTVFYRDMLLSKNESCTVDEWEAVFRYVTINQEVDGRFCERLRYMKLDTISPTENHDFEFQYAKAVNDFGVDNFEMIEFELGKWTSKIIK